MVVTVVISLTFLSFSYAQISITGSDGLNYTIQGQRYGINCTVPAALDTSIVMKKGLDRVCSLLMESCPILPTNGFPCGCSINAAGDRVLYHTTDNATVREFDDVWLCSEFNNTKTSASLDVTVYSGPNNIRLNSSSLILILGDEAAQAVQCSADCNPQCSYSWYKGSPATASVVSGHRVLSADIIQKQLPGSQVYTCVAINRMKPVNNKQTVVLDVLVVPSTKPVAVAPRKSFLQGVNGTDVSSPNSSTLANTPRLTPPTTTIQSTTITTIQSTTTQSTTTTTVPTTTTTTTTSTTSPNVVGPESSDLGSETALIVGVVVSVIVVLIVLIVVTVIVVLIVLKRGRRQARNGRTISYAPGNPIYANNPGTVGVTPNLQGTIMIRNDDPQATFDQDGVRSPVYVNTNQPTLYSSLDKEQLKEQPSNTYEQLHASPSSNPETNLYIKLDNQQKHESSETQNNLGNQGSPLYMNTGSGSNIFGYGTNSESTKTDANDVSEEPVSLEYMNLNVSRA